MDIRCLKSDGGYDWSKGFTYRDVFLVKKPDGRYFLYLRENGKQVSLADKKDIRWCFFEKEVYTPPAFEIARYKKLLNKENDMDMKERIAKLEAELAELKKEVEFRPFLAWVSLSNETPNNKDMPAIIDSYDVKASHPYRTLKGYTGWKYATPLTREEILSYLPPVKSKYDWDAILKVYPNAQVAARHPNGDIVIGSQSEIKVGSGGFNSASPDGVFLFVGSKPEWILDKDCDWRDSIEYRRDVQ